MSDQGREIPAPLPGSEPAPPPATSRIAESSAALIGVAAVVAVVAVAAFAIFTMPGGESQSANIVSVATAAFGVLGALAGSFFAVRSADKGMSQVAAQQQRTARDPRSPSSQF